MTDPVVSVISCIYNRVALVRRVIPPVLAYTDVPFEYILIYNHPPDGGEVLKYIKSWEKENSNVRIIDPGKNVGYLAGCNLGFTEARGKYVVKLDDDTIVPGQWASKMIKAFEVVPDLAFLSADLNIEAKQKVEYELENHPEGVALEIPKQGIVGFSCVMFPKVMWEKMGRMRAGPYIAAGEEGTIVDGVPLYGGEEVYYVSRAQEFGLKFAHYPPVKVQHLGVEDRDPDYICWKFWYGLRAKTRKSLDLWKQDREDLIRAYEDLVTYPNDVWKSISARRLGELESVGSLKLLKSITTNNGVVLEALNFAIDKLEPK